MPTVVMHIVPRMLPVGSYARFIGYVSALPELVDEVVPLSPSVGSIAMHVRPEGQPLLVWKNPMYGLEPQFWPLLRSQVAANNVSGWPHEHQVSGICTRSTNERRAPAAAAAPQAQPRPARESRIRNRGSG